MHELIIATTNQGKLREIRELLKDLDVKITSLSDYPDAPRVEKDGKNFAQNALKKAATIALYTGKLTLGEDSGLEVKALGNKPGIYSARFSLPKANKSLGRAYSAGNGATDKKNNAANCKRPKFLSLIIQGENDQSIYNPIIKKKSQFR